jgi:hypothetical protein
MSEGTAFGFLGDFLTFLGGLLLAIDAVLEERKLKRAREKTHKWENTIKSPVLANVTLTREGIQLKTKDNVELSLDISMVRRSSRRAALGAVILTLGFISLFVSRCLELKAEAIQPAAGETRQ